MPRKIYANRTLNLRSIRAIGYDMDYTLIHYRVDEWETHAYANVKRQLLAEGWPVAALELDPHLMTRGLVVDTELGNVVKANRFGFVKRAFHGTRLVEYEALRETYSRVIVDLAEPRFQFMNTLFSISEMCLYAQLVDLMDAGQLPPSTRYSELYWRVRRAIDYAHVEGQLKGEVIEHPERFVDLDPEVALALLDQRQAGKKLLLITNSDWSYTNAMMAYAFDRFLPGSMTWRELFDLVIVEARKPAFFTRTNPAFEVVNEEGLLRPLTGRMAEGGAYLGGDAGMVEAALGIAGDQILFVGDHIFSDVHVSKNIQRWRTALVLRELEPEVEAIRSFEAQQVELTALMREKEALEDQLEYLKVSELRTEGGYAPGYERPPNLMSELSRLRAELVALDARISPLAQAAGELASSTWGLLMRAGNDKSHLARQVERYADIYMARVSDFAAYSPFVYLRSSRGSLPHDP